MGSVHEIPFSKDSTFNYHSYTRYNNRHASTYLTIRRIVTMKAVLTLVLLHGVSLVRSLPLNANPIGLSTIERDVGSLV